MSEVIGPLVGKPSFTEAEMSNGAVKSYDRYGNLAARIEVLEQEKKMNAENFTALNKNYEDLKAALEQLCQKVVVFGKEKEDTSIQDQFEMSPVVSEVIQKNESACLGLSSIIWSPEKIKREEIKYVVFLDSFELRRNDAWDVSDVGNQSVLAWIENKWIENNRTLYIAAQGGVKANKNCANLFENFENLREIKFGGNFDTSEVVDMRAMFCNCRSLTKLDIVNFNTSNVKDMSYMFSGCRNLVELDIRGFNTSGVKDMSDMFYNCEKLLKLDMTGIDTSSVTNMKSMFNGCRNLTELDIVDFDTSNVKNMSYMFFDCERLTKLDMTGIIASSVTKTENMFWHCISLQELVTTSFSILLEWDLWDKALKG